MINCVLPALYTEVLTSHIESKANDPYMILLGKPQLRQLRLTEGESLNAMDTT